MPANRFTFTVRVGRQYQPVRLLGFIGNRLELLGLIGIIVPQHCKVVIGIDRAVLGRQIADMAV